ncbi:MAG: winged helix-turn-helix domain-containing protein, partial [Clostridia bacterium]|nr:winged helix-turn-helix domain-containing protein [Clostridia bacterium]
MLILITDRILIERKLTTFLNAHGVYLFCAVPETGAYLCEQKDTGSVILDCVSNLHKCEKLCAELRTRYPELPIAAIVPRDSIPNLPADRILRDPADGVSYPLLEDALRFCHSCGWDERPFTVYDLRVGLDPDDVYYMGYHLPLSPSEHKILRCLFYRAPRVTSTSDLMALCYPEQSEKRANLSVLISRINRRAAKIDTRPLIVNIYGEGYRLRNGIFT